MAWFVALSIVVGVGLAGLALLAVGLRGRRVDDHPLCRACGFDLTGASKTSTRCPECGRVTTRPRVGHHRRRVGPLVIGAALTAIALLVGGTLGVGVIRGVDWRDKLPTAWLLREATRGAIADRGDPIARLLARDAASPLPAAARVALARAIIAVQPDARIAWRPTWGDWVAARLVDRTLPADARDAFVGELFANVAVEIRPVVRRGDALPIAIKVASPRNRCTYLVPLDDAFNGADRRLTVDGVAMPAAVGGTSTNGFLRGTTGLNTSETGNAWRSVDVGRHVVEWQSAIEVRAKNGPPGLPVLAEVPLRWRGSVSVVEVNGDADVRLIDDPLGLLRAAIGEASIRMPTRTTSAMLEVRYATTLPSALAVDVFVRQDGGKEQSLTTITRAANERPGQYGYGGYGASLHAGVAQLILRASPAVVRRTTDLFDVWGGELRIDDVPVIDPNAMTTRPTTKP